MLLCSWHWVARCPLPPRNSWCNWINRHINNKNNGVLGEHKKLTSLWERQGTFRERLTDFGVRLWIQFWSMHYFAIEGRMWDGELSGILIKRRVVKTYGFRRQWMGIVIKNISCAWVAERQWEKKLKMKKPDCEMSWKRLTMDNRKPFVSFSFFSFFVCLFFRGGVRGGSAWGSTIKSLL